MKSEAGQCEEHASEERWRDVGYQAEQGERRMRPAWPRRGCQSPSGVKEASSVIEMSWSPSRARASMRCKV